MGRVALLRDSLQYSLPLWTFNQAERQHYGGEESGQVMIVLYSVVCKNDLCHPLVVYTYYCRILSIIHDEPVESRVLIHGAQLLMQSIPSSLIIELIKHPISE